MKVYRNEIKQYISYLEYCHLKNILAKTMKKDRFQTDENGYFIRSLYFDSIHDNDFIEKIIGVENRKKIRLRIYDLNTDKVKLEIKNKYGEYMLKESVTITRSEALDLIRGNTYWMTGKDNETLNKVYYYFKKDYYRPSIIIDYMRDAYMLDFNNIRITFDKNVRTSKRFDSFFDNKADNFICTNPETVILEIKYDRQLPYWVKELFSCYSPDKQAISKFCMGIINIQNKYMGDEINEY